ncbi:hypothetical protein B0H21DRAFT_130489 [Amylocystis lapponica]|nr:hypothetical protein B0H21DRAFT_130489 [Amylocystis lapponica]
MQRGVVRTNNHGEISPPRKRGFLATTLSPTRSLSLSDISITRATGRKRVNPESLATRLGPELIKELEALLEPGMSEMPSFSVRQEIQKRYNINRRHIYDWFHSRGLRVTKEERRVAREVHRAGTHAERLIKKCPTLPTSMPVLSRSPSLVCSDSSDGAFNVLSQVPLFKAGDPFVQTPPAYYPNCYFGPPVYALSLDGSSAQTSPIYLSPPFLVEDTSPQPNTLVDVGSSQVCQIFEKISDLEVFQTSCSIPSSSITSVQSEQIKSLLPLHGDECLPQQERTAYYECLSGVLGPATGFQESVGSYKTFMTQQTQKYYERLLPNDTDSSQSPNNLSPAAAVPVQLSTHTRGSIAEVISMSRCDLTRSGQPAPPVDWVSANKEEFSNWLLYGGRSHSSSPACTPDLSSDCSSETSQSWSSGSLDDPSQSICVLDLADILQSPVLRSRNSSYVQDRYTAFPEVRNDIPLETFSCDAGDISLKRQDVSTLRTIPCGDGSPDALQFYLQDPALFSVPSKQNSDLSQNVHHANASHGLEKAAKSEITGRTKRSRLGRARMNSAGGGCDEC